jgi:protein gp88
METKLRFGRGNAKLAGDIYTFSLPAGYACPGALQCMAKADRHTGKLQDGPSQSFRCFAAGDESRYPSVRRLRWHNFNLLKGQTREGMTALILASLPVDAKLVRLHVSGDFFSDIYFLAWMDVAKTKTETLFYTYTKSLPIWLRNRSSVPANFKLTASEGGKHDDLIEAESLKYAKVLFSIEEARMLGLEIDHDDSHAYASDESFALLFAWQPAQRNAGREGYVSTKKSWLQRVFPEASRKAKARFFGLRRMSRLRWNSSRRKKAGQMSFPSLLRQRR